MRAAKIKKVPLRTCVGCRETKPKKDMIRVVKSPESAKIDPTSRASGRGAYICEKESCLQIAVKRRSLERSIGAKIDDGLVKELQMLIKNKGD